MRFGDSESRGILSCDYLFLTFPLEPDREDPEEERPDEPEEERAEEPEEDLETDDLERDFEADGLE